MTLASNNALKHGEEFGFHLVNILIHTLTTVLIFFTVRISLGVLRVDFTSPKSCKIYSNELAFLVACIFVLHPLATEGVTYVASRASQLATFFCVSALFCFLRVFNLKRLSFVASVAWLLLIVFLYYLGMASKLIAVPLPAILASYFVLLICPMRYPKLFSALSGKKILIGYGMILITCLWSATRFFLLGDSGMEAFGRSGYLLIQFKVILCYYLKTFIFPINQSLDIAFPYEKISEDPWISFSMLVLSGVTILVLVKGDRLLKIASLSLIFALSPTSSILPLNDLAMEHRMYFPMAIGLCLIAGSMIIRIPKNIRRIFTMILIISLGVLTTARNQVWNNEGSLWEDVLEKAPRSVRAYGNLGIYHYNQGNLNHALQYLEKSVMVGNKISENHYNLANLYFDLNRLKEAEKEYSMAIWLDPAFSESSHFGLGGLYMRWNRAESALEEYAKAIETRRLRNGKPSEYPLAQLGLGRAYGVLGRYEDAIREFKLAVALKPSMYKAHYNLGTAYIKMGRTKEGENAFLESLKINPSFKYGLLALGRLYQIQKRWKESSFQYFKLLEIEKRHSGAIFSLGVNAMQLGDIISAKNYFRRTLEIDSENGDAYMYLGKLLSGEGNFKHAETFFLKALKLKPEIFQVHMQLGLIALRHHKDRLEALRYFNSAMQRAQKPEVKKQIEQLIAQLS